MQDTFLDRIIDSVMVFGIFAAKAGIAFLAI